MFLTLEPEPDNAGVGSLPTTLSWFFVNERY